MKINKIIKNDIEKNIPDLKNNIVNSVDWQEIKNKNINKQSERHKLSFGLKLLTSLCCFIVFAFSIGLPIILTNKNTKNSNSVYEMTLSVNPAVRFEFNEKNIITKQCGLNEDGVLLLYKEDFVGKNIDDATKLLINELNARGFVQGKTIKMCVKNEKGEHIEKKEQELSLSIKTILNKIQNSKFEELKDLDFDAIEDYYETNQIKIGEYETNLINEFKTKIIETIDNKILDINKLINDVKIFVKGKENSEEIILANSLIITQFLNFEKKYNYNFDLNFDCLSYCELFEYIVDLNEDIDDLEEIKLEIEENGKDEDDLGDNLAELFEDLIDYVKDAMFDD